MILLRSQILKSRDTHPVDGHGFRKHRSRADPQAALAVFLTVNDEFLVGLAVTSDSQHSVLVSFVMAISAGRHGKHG